MSGNFGHGWVTPREDGVKARCGGPAMCAECQAELRRKAYEEGSNDLVHSDAFVVMFLGYLMSQRLTAPYVRPEVILEAWYEFKHKMGKNPDGTAPLT